MVTCLVDNSVDVLLKPKILPLTLTNCLLLRRIPVFCIVEMKGIKTDNCLNAKVNVDLPITPEKGTSLEAVKPSCLLDKFCAILLIVDTDDMATNCCLLLSNKVVLFNVDLKPKLLFNDLYVILYNNFCNCAIAPTDIFSFLYEIFNVDVKNNKLEQKKLLFKYDKNRVVEEIN